jgi:crossover junction endodeoxyribonuclease RusA
VISLPWPPKELSPNARLHWAAKAKATKAYRQHCFAMAKMSRLTVDPEKKYIMRLEFFRPARRHYDDDNLIARMKAGRDGIAQALGIDDKQFTVRHIMREKVVPGGVVLCGIYEDVERPAPECYDD